ncbi:hypothetical protein [Calothrix sp. CCY 0018]|uniref:hypothetical protein n=1 Tax=Calothrix sp. CCY 0018 TaxID=3103864 RepID=UPI0039C634D6
MPCLYGAVFLRREISHAWLINNKGEVIDPTWIEKNHKSTVYFGIAFNRNYVEQMYEKNEQSYSILENFHMNGNEFMMTKGFPPHVLHKI